MRELLIAMGLMASDMTARVAVEMAVSINTTPAPVTVQQCCGLCVNGIVTHGDGHKTQCKCPPNCKCKAPKSQAPICTSGTCALKK